MLGATPMPQHSVSHAGPPSERGRVSASFQRVSSTCWMSWARAIGSRASNGWSRVVEPVGGEHLRGGDPLIRCLDCVVPLADSAADAVLADGLAHEAEETCAAGAAAFKRS